MKLLLVLIAGFTSAGITMAYLAWAMQSARMQKFLISEDPHRNVTDEKLYKSVALNMVVSLALVFGMTFGLQDYLFYDRDVPVWSMVLEGVAAILVYDFAYYFMHRFPFHEWAILRNVHAVHHAAQNPRAIDSLLLHPVETFLGLALLLGSIAAVGGIHIYTFAPIFFAYTSFNVFNHAGMNVPHFPLATLGWLADKHDKHHHSMISGNYASITPLPDIIFGTVE